LPSEKSQPTSPSGLTAKGFRFAIVASRWNEAIVSRLIDGARKALKETGADDGAVEIFRVPGAFELPLCAQKAAEARKFDAVICLGVVIRGDTPHFEYVAASAARGIGEASLRTGVPLLFGVITADNTRQADERSRDDANNKGYEAARAAIEVVTLFRERFAEKRTED
jgi:6,7-dimethyl-8-ribityllumazine synthase